MRFIHRDKPNVKPGGHGGKPLAFEPLGRNIQDAQRPCVGLLDHPAEGNLIKARVNAPGRDARLLQGGHLVLHQGDQRRDDKRYPAEQDGRNLVTDRFAGAGRHDSQHVTATEQRVDDRFLPGVERAVAKIGLQGCVLIHPLSFPYFVNNLQNL